MDETRNHDHPNNQASASDEATTNGGADAMLEAFMLTSIEQLRVIADPLRLRILDTLITRALTVTQLGKQLGESPAKLHYHVRELERLGMVRLVATREKEGILEKYFRAVARNYRAPANLLQTVPRDDFIATVSETISRLSQGFLRALTTTQDSEQHPDMLLFGGSTLWLKPGELTVLMDQVQHLLDPYKEPRGVDGERELMLLMMGYDAQLGAEHGEETLSATQAHMAHAQSSDVLPAQPRPRRVVVIGALAYKRTDLEQVIARGEQLAINVSGYCSFADDVTPDLIDRAIARLRYRGVLSATPAVREALRRKENTKEEKPA
ncbi:MAG: helix-turn-helix domain-containing protein [Ktedonobacterales bacterium]